LDHTLSDAKGHWVYHMLRRRVGDEVFFATLRKLIEKFDGRTMSLNTLRQEFAAAAPEADLVEFFSQWLDRKGAPLVEARCVRVADRTQLQLRQVQNGKPYLLDLDVELRMRDGKKERRRVWVGTNKRESFDLKLAKDAVVESVVVDPDHALLLWHPEYGPAPNDAVEADPVVNASARAVYLGDYAVEGRELTVRVVERGERLGIIVGDGAQEKLLLTGEHRFHSDKGRIQFEVVDGKARALEFRSNGGRKVRAKRR
jgi:hypothetical protein